MSKIIVGRKVIYLEVFEVDTNKVPSGRDDLDLCQRVLCCADPILSQRLKSFTDEARSSIKFLYRIQDSISENPIIKDLPDCQKGWDECPRY